VFLLVTTSSSVEELTRRLRAEPEVVWASPAYGPYPLVAYAETATPAEQADFVERVRQSAGVDGLDARMCKWIPGDDDLPPFEAPDGEAALLLINVDYRVEKERNVVYSLRENRKARLVRAMWGPADVVALVGAADHEALRNVICDEVKTTKGVASNTTLYCYPRTWVT
jgi:DNA-binding Lrp family transcriptional regulator